MSLQILHPPDWLPPIGYANGISVVAGRIVLSLVRLGCQSAFPKRGAGSAIRTSAQKHIGRSRAGMRDTEPHLPTNGILYRQARLSCGPARPRAHLEFADGKPFPHDEHDFCCRSSRHPGKEELRRLNRFKPCIRRIALRSDAGQAQRLRPGDNWRIQSWFAWA